MAVRTSQGAVELIIKVDSDITDFTPFIAAANRIVTLACTGNDQGYSVAHLTDIETWLAAHFVAIRDMRPADEKIGASAITCQGKTDMYLESTLYGQQAMLLDVEGGLAALNQKMKKGAPLAIGATWLGTDLDETEADDGT